MIYADAVAAHCNLWCDIIQTTTDPAHIAAELIFNIVFDGLILFLLWGKIIKPRLMKQVHTELDAEHGITHEDHDNINTSTRHPD